MGTTLQVNMKQGTGKILSLYKLVWQNYTFVNLGVMVLGMILFCSYSFHLTFSSVLYSNTLVLSHAALVILSGCPATTDLNLFTSYDNVWAIIQGVFY